MATSNSPSLPVTGVVPTSSLPVPAKVGDVMPSNGLPPFNASLPPLGNSVALPPMNALLPPKVTAYPQVGSLVPPSSAALPPISSMPLPPLGGSADDGDDEELELPEEDDGESSTAPLGGTSSGMDPLALQVQTPMFQNPTFHIVARADFVDGYTFRQQWEFYKQSLSCAPMFFTENGVSIRRGNGTTTLIVDTLMRDDDLMDHYVDKTRWNWKDCHVINVNLKDFHGHIKSVAMKESVRIYQYAEYPELVFIQLYGGNKNSNGYITVRTEKFEPIDYHIDDGSKETDKPNVKVPLAMFCTACGNVARVKFPYAVLRVYPKGAHLMAGNEIGTSSRNAHWGDCSGIVESKSRLAVKGKTKTPVVYSTKIPLDVVKAMVKMTNFNKGGLLSIYGNGDGVVRLQTPVGHYAAARIHLHEPETQK